MMRASIASLAILAACNHEHDPEHDEQCEDTYEGYVSVPPPAPVPAGSFGFVLFDVGQGDSALVVAPSGCAALLDGGPTGAGNAVIKPSLAAMGITSLDFAIASHYHADHIGGLDEIDAGSDAVALGTVYDRGGTYASLAFDAYAGHFGNRRQRVAAGDTFTLCNEVTFRVISADANGTSTSNENARSVVVKISYGAFDAVVGGDLTGSSPNIESTIAPAIGEVELYKVHHHGSSTSSNATLVSTLLPTVSVIPVGMNNTYGHPDPGTVARLQDAGSDIWQTENPQNGTALGHIQLTSANGEAYAVQQGPYMQGYTAKGGTADTTPPTVPADVSATAVAATRIDVAWSASTDDVGVARYTIYRNGSVLTTTTATAYSDTSVGAGQTHTYEVTASDAANNTSGLSAPATATTPEAPPPACSTTITQLQWSKGKGELAVRATNTQQPAAQLEVSADGTPLGAMTFLANKGFYELKTKRPQPACITVTASCGDVDTSCFAQ